jgi:Protein of unknown function (DUF3105)
MAHRKEEKERRREERLAKERAEAAAAARRRRFTLALGGALAAAAVVGAVALAGSVTLSGDDAGSEPRQADDVAEVQLPEPQIGDLEGAAEAAKCTVRHPEIEGQAHADKVFKASDYKTNPPTSGEHNPVWYEDGIYEPGSAPDLGMQVHSLEHGRINLQYRAGTPASTIAELEALWAEQSDGYHMLLYENVTDMPYAVAATAWGHFVGCRTMSPEVFDALRTFRNEYIDQGPENVP